MKKNIVLIGFMGSGKSTIGRYLAKQLDYLLIDTDKEIERKENKTINKIFEEQGEKYFRACETQLLREMESSKEKCIISTGGGMPLLEENGRLLNKMGFVVYLNVQKNTVMDRLRDDITRPLLAGDDAEKKVSDLLEFRNPIYEYTAHMMIETDHKTIDEIVEEIIRNYKIMTGDSGIVQQR